MLLQILFKKLKIKENRYLLAFVYALFYFFVFFVILWIFQKKIILNNLFLSLFIGILMFFVYLMRIETIKILKKQ